MQGWPTKEDVMGTGISVTSFAETMELFERTNTDRAITVNVCNVHSVMTARKDADLAAALNAGEINTSDGVPLVWVLRTRGHRSHQRMYGPDLTDYALSHGLSRGWRHFFYGSTQPVLDALLPRLRAQYPGIQIAGSYAPPFRDLTVAERDEVAATILGSGANIVWVGLGMPKQEKWMYQMREHLPGTVLVGVGAAFDFMAGTKPQAPHWMQRTGLEWAFRLASEPRRLWRRYIWNNPAFLALWIRDLAERNLRHKPQ